jgi:hypothetical protein
VGHLLELTLVEEDPPAPLALLDVDAPPLDGVHSTLTLRTDHPASVLVGGDVAHAPPELGFAPGARTRPVRSGPAHPAGAAIQSAKGLSMTLLRMHLLICGANTGVTGPLNLVSGACDLWDQP